MRGEAKIKNPTLAKKRSTLIISAVAAVVIIGVIAGVFLIKNGGGSVSKVSGKVTDAAA